MLGKEQVKRVSYTWPIALPRTIFPENCELPSLSSGQLHKKSNRYKFYLEVEVVDYVRIDFLKKANSYTYIIFV